MTRVFIPLAAAVAALATVAAAFAHAEPAKVNPGDGAVLDQAPTFVEITMSQELARQADGNDIDVFDADGKEVTIVSAVIDNGDRRKITVTLPQNLKPGTYQVKWKTLSAEDGDTAQGTLSFTFDPTKPVNLGRTDLKADTTAAAGNSGPSSSLGYGFEGGGGTSWILVVAVAVGMFVVGSGATYFLVQKRP